MPISRDQKGGSENLSYLGQTLDSFLFFSFPSGQTVIWEEVRQNHSGVCRKLSVTVLPGGL